MDVVELLLDANADVHAKPASYSARTVLQPAAERGYIRLLLAVKANVNAKPVRERGLKHSRRQLTDLVQLQLWNEANDMKSNAA